MMYSQYNYYHNNASNAFGAVPTGATSITTQQGSQYWNGHAWVPIGSTVPFTHGNTTHTPVAQQQRAVSLPAGVLSLPPAPPHLQTLDVATTSPSQLVTQYSVFYQYWSNHAKEQKQLASVLAEGSAERDEAERRGTWAEYYSDQCSRLAYFYKAKDQEPPVQATAPSPQPAPVALQSDNNSGITRKPSRWGVASKSLNEDEESTPDSLKRYVHRSLSRCTTPAQKHYVQSELERLISEAIQRDGALLSCSAGDKYWDSLALIPLEPPQSCSAASAIAETCKSTDSSTSSLSVPNNHPTRCFSHKVDDDSSRESDRLNSVSTANSIQQKFNVLSGKVLFNEGAGGEVTVMSGDTKDGKKQNKRTDSYVNTLPANDSYYGNGGVTDPDTLDNSDFVLFSSCASSHHPSHRSNKKSKRKFDHNQNCLSINKSYYGASGVTADAANSGDTGDDISVTLSSSSLVSLKSGSYMPSHRKQEQIKQEQKKQKKNNKQKFKYQRQGDGLESFDAALTRRANRFSGQGGIATVLDASIHFNSFIDVDKYMGKSIIGGTGHNGADKKQVDELDYELMTVKGTCHVLEKEYLRLTAPPRADLVRPHAILKQHLANLKKRWSDNGRTAMTTDLTTKDDLNKKENGKDEYEWLCSQLKAVRQDLTVQRIFDTLTVEVYETHARIALENGDLNEYNQCQTQLKELYDLLSHNLMLSKNFRQNNVTNLYKDECLEKQKSGLENQHEFIAYRIIYYVFLTLNNEYSGGSSDLFKIMISLTLAQRSDPCIVHALKVRVAVAESDYHSFFRLVASCPNMGSYLMSCMVPQVRTTALKIIMKAFRPSISVTYVLKELGFDVNGIDNVEEGKIWLTSCGCVLSSSNNNDESSGDQILTNKSVYRDCDKDEKKKSLI